MHSGRFTFGSGAGFLVRWVGLVGVGRVAFAWVVVVGGIGKEWRGVDVDGGGVGWCGMV